MAAPMLSDTKTSQGFATELPVWARRESELGEPPARLAPRKGLAGGGDGARGVDEESLGDFGVAAGKGEAALKP